MHSNQGITKLKGWPRPIAERDKVVINLVIDLVKRVEELEAAREKDKCSD